MFSKHRIQWHLKKWKRGNSLFVQYGFFSVNYQLGDNNNIIKAIYMITMVMIVMPQSWI